jgi:uncharacterized delta-60 repeat protein
VFEVLSKAIAMKRPRIVRSAFAGLLLGALAVAASIALASAAVHGHAGAIDRSFGSSGLALHDFGSQPYWGGAKRVISTPDGGLLVLTINDSIARFSPDGSLDTGFGEGGFITADTYGAQAMTTTADGKIVTVGARRTLVTAAPRSEVHRYLPDGSPDPSFGKNGAAVFARPPDATWGEGVVVEPGGKVIVLARVFTEGYSAISAVRLTERGRLDRSYGSGGFTMARAGTSYGEFVNMPLLPRVYSLNEGKLTIALSSEKETLLMRLGADGRLDPGFGADGKIYSKEYSEPVTALAIDPTGRMVLSSEYGSLARFLPDGNLDPSFGEGGTLHHLPFGSFSLRVVDLTPEGKILLGGNVSEPTTRGPESFLLARLEPDGALDASFGGGSGFVAKTLAPGSHDEALDLVQVSDGDILLAGVFTPAGGFNPSSQIGLVRYAADGSLEQGFGDGGVSITRPRVQSSDEVGDVLPVAGGKTVVVGWGGGGIVVSRYTRSGRPDPTFGREGFAAPVAVSHDYFGERATSVAPYPGGRLLVGTHSRSGGGLLRYLADGRLDPGFGHDGVLATAPFDGVLDVATAPGGDILAVGVEYHECHLILARFHPDGGLDQSFAGGEGQLPVGIGYGPCPRLPARLAVRRDGSIIVAGSWSSRLVVVSPAGRRNVDFGRHGKHGVGRAIPSRIRTVAVDPRGRILVAGTEDKKFAISRLTPRGFPDRSFGRGGTVLTARGHSAEISALGLEADGSIVAAGISKRCNDVVFCRDTLPVVAHYLPSGARDRGFAEEGIWSGRIGTAANLGAISLRHHSITAAGWATRPGTSRDLLLLRLRG